MWQPKYINTDITLYVAIADAIESDIESGLLKAGEKMPTQRSIADIIGVNLTTITRAYNLCKKRNLLEAVTGKGTFVSDKRKELLLEVNSHDGIIDFGLVGSLKIHDKRINNLMEDIIKDNRMDDLLDYHQSNGILSHRQAASKWVSLHGVEASPDDIVICSGVMHAINSTLRTIFEAEDKIAVDAQTFSGFINAGKLNHVKLEAIEMDDQGMLVESLELACKRNQIKGIYLMPTLQNPTSTRMSDERKEAISAVIKKYDLLLIEDDVYNLFDDSNRKPLYNLVPEQTVYICGTSKTLYPGLRIAYAVVPQKYQFKFIQTVTDTIWMAPPISSELCTRLINSGIASEIVQKKRRIISKRISILKDMLKDYDVQVVDNSQFAWLKLPTSIPAIAFEHTALINKVKIIAADKFTIFNSVAPNCVRISVANVASEEELIKGLNVLVKILKNPEILTRTIM